MLDSSVFGAFRGFVYKSYVATVFLIYFPKKVKRKLYDICCASRTMVVVCSSGVS